MWIQQEQEIRHGKNNTEEKVFCSQGAGSSGGIAESCTGKEITGFREGKHGTGSSRADRDQSEAPFINIRMIFFRFHEETRGKTITFIIQMDDEPGILSVVLQTIAHFHGNILTIHQSIPINGIATLTLSVDILPGEGDAEAMIEEIESQEGIHYLKILGRE